jgi:pyruvate dehydrogenase E2 component (dihydrolipoamide acetyltransferase)
VSAEKSIVVPDIGDFKNIPVIEILVKSGDRVLKDSPLVVLESDKATLDVPSPEEGTVKELKIAVGDRVSIGTVILTLEMAELELAAAMPAMQAAAIASIDPITPSPRELPKAEVAAPPTTGRRIHASPSIRRIARELGVELSAVSGTGPRGRIVRADLQQYVKNALAARFTGAPNGTVDADNTGLGFRLAPWPQIDFSKFGPIERAPLSKPEIRW